MVLNIVKQSRSKILVVVCTDEWKCMW
jgi:hypothetical protein